MNRHELDFNNISGEIIEQLRQGAFLTVKVPGKVNVMTIGWGQLGIMWNIPVFVVPVRLSRYTYELLEKTDEFSVSVPARLSMAKELAFCGSRTGRDTDKVSAMGIRLLDPQRINTPVIAGCRYHLECRIRARVLLNKESFVPEFAGRFYNSGDYHMLFYGEIISCYSTDHT